MIDPLSESRLKTVHPTLAARVMLLISDFYAATNGDELIVAQALRNWYDQEQLWLKGRDGQGNVVDAAAVVTNAPPGHSWHEYGLAVDLVPESLLNTEDWCPASPLWPLIANLAKARGMMSGSCWQHKDLPHVQLTGKFGVSPDAWVRTLFLQQGGISAVWKASGIPAI